MKKIKKDPQRITEIKPFINKYNWEEINFSSEKDDWKKFRKTNVTIALNVLCAKNEKVHPAYVLKHYSNREKQVLLLTAANGEGWHYLAVKKLSALLKGITSKHITVIFVVSIAFNLLQYKKKPAKTSIKKHVQIKIFIFLM